MPLCLFKNNISAAENTLLSHGRLSSVSCWAGSDLRGSQNNKGGGRGCKALIKQPRLLPELSRTLSRYKDTEIPSHQKEYPFPRLEAFTVR